MSREDWEVYEEMRRQRQEKRRQRRETFSGGPGWTKHHDTHWSYILQGDRLDYWPGPMRWRWRNRSMTGDVVTFIAKREKNAQE